MEDQEQYEEKESVRLSLMEPRISIEEVNLRIMKDEYLRGLEIVFTVPGYIRTTGVS
jgi:hypothetical protein